MKEKGTVPSMMTIIVVFSLLFCTAIVIWGMVQAGDGTDSAAIVDSALRVFGTELGICGFMTIFKRVRKLRTHYNKVRGKSQRLFTTKK